MHPYVINVLLLLSSGAFAFLGAVEIPESDSDEEDGSCMLFNVVVATTLCDLEEKAVELIASASTSRIDVRSSPWYLDKDGALKIYFCYRGASTEKYIHTQDPFLPLAEDLQSWRSSFTEEYFCAAVARRGLLHKLRIEGYFGRHVASVFASIGPLETAKRDKIFKLLMSSWRAAQPGSASSFREH